MLAVKRANTKLVFSGKATKNSNGALTITLPLEESKLMAADEYLITVEGPINSKRTTYNKIVISV